MHSIALGVAMGVLAQLGVSGPVPLVFDCPALAHQSQEGLWAGTQGGDKEMQVMKRLAVSPSGAHQLSEELDQQRGSRHKDLGPSDNQSLLSPPKLA